MVYHHPTDLSYLVYRKEQCWVLIRFVIFINDLPWRVKNSIRLFKDDRVLYTSGDTEDLLSLQDDLNTLEEWQNQWKMRFNLGKCKIMQITTKRDATQTKVYLLRRNT
jgi:hypothetical protein